MADEPTRLRARLGTRFRGDIIDRDQPDYERVRRVWNGMIDRNPLLVLRPADIASVQAAVRLAGELERPLAVRGGGHNVAGTGTCDDELVLDLSLLGGLRVDPQRRIVRAPGGSTWAPVDQATQVHGLATVGGMVSTTGVGGLTLGGGVGWLMRSYGLTCDNLVSVDLVTAAGDLITASDETHPDLLWALRGGGGNFGVVTHFTYRLHPVGTVVGGFVMYSLDRAAEVLRRYAGYCERCPDTVTTLVVLTTAPDQPFVPERLRGRPVLLVAVCDITAEAGTGDLLAALGAPDLNLTAAMPYCDLQSMQDPTAPHGSRNYWKSGYLPGLTGQLIDLLVDFAARAPSPMTQIHVHQMGGAVVRVAGDATAVSFRDAPYMINIVGMWNDVDSDAVNLEWLADCWRRVEPQIAGAYSNFLAEGETDRVPDAYSAEVWKRLRDIKSAWDPRNMFRYNHNIPPHADHP